MKKAFLHHWLNPFYSELDRIIGPASSLLDVGCGSSTPLKNLDTRPKRLVGADGFQPSIDISQQNHFHDEYINTDLLDIDKAFKPNSFEVVVALDVIEHFSKQDGVHLLHKMETIASKKVVIFTPSGFLQQSEHSGNILQRHLSGWTAQEMEQLGYQVIGINGWKPLLGEFALPRFWPKKLWILISRLTQPLVRNHPKHAFAILCVKDMQKNSHD